MVPKHVPYRDSKLTHILKDSLGSNSYTHLIITLSPSYLCLPETISTLAFTKNAKAVKQNVIENTHFKQEVTARKRIEAELLRRQSEKSAFLSQIGNQKGDSEEERFLREVLSDIHGDRSSMESKAIREMFQMTLEWLKNIREDHHGLERKIDELKRALNHDMDNQGRHRISRRSEKSPISDARIKIKSLKSISEENANEDYTPDTAGYAGSPKRNLLKNMS